MYRMGDGGRTPMHDSGSRTPHYGAGNQTPLHDGSRTPAWDPTITNTPAREDNEYYDTSYNPATPGGYAAGTTPFTPHTPGGYASESSHYSPYQASPAGEGRISGSDRGGGSGPGSDRDRGGGSSERSRDIGELLLDYWDVWDKLVLLLMSYRKFTNLVIMSYGEVVTSCCGFVMSYHELCTTCDEMR